jgi:hypothetical protein
MLIKPLLMFPLHLSLQSGNGAFTYPPIPAPITNDKPIEIIIDINPTA